MLRKLITTDNSTSWFILRVTLGTVMLGHGLQKLMGWFGGFGWQNTVNYFNGIGLPEPLGALIILVESFGAIFLILGFAGRLNAFLMGVVILGAFFIDHLPNGFFMNWFKNQQGEGFEFDLLFLAISSVIAINGSGRYSVDRWLMKQSAKKRETVSGVLKHA